MAQRDDSLEIVATVTLADALRGLARLVGVTVDLDGRHTSSASNSCSSCHQITQPIPIWRDGE